MRKGGMLGPVPGAVKAIRLLLVLVACGALASGCFWRSYPRRARTHAEVLVGVARKATDLVATGRFTAETLPELTYPLERATAFATEARGRAPSPPPASLAAFDTLLARYRTFVDAADEARRRRAGAAEALASPLAQVEAAAHDLDTALAAESR